MLSYLFFSSNWSLSSFLISFFFVRVKLLVAVFPSRCVIVLSYSHWVFSICDCTLLLASRCFATGALGLTWHHNQDKKYSRDPASRRVPAPYSVTQGLTESLLKNTRNGQVNNCHLYYFVAGHKSVSSSVWHDILLKFGVSKFWRKTESKIVKFFVRSLPRLDELENLFRSYWLHRLGVSDGLLQVFNDWVTISE